jgi:hypothetical protein
VAAKKRTVRFFVPFRRQPGGTTIPLSPNFWTLFRNKLTPLTYAAQFQTIRGVEYRGGARHERTAGADYFFLGKTRDQNDFPEARC